MAMHVLGAVVLLALGSSFLWIVSESIAGDEEPALHFGNVALVTLIGTGGFLVWGWTAIAVVLGAFGAWWIAVGVLERSR
jgi:hypothetical protein